MTWEKTAPTTNAAIAAMTTRTTVDIATFLSV
jgi:hypothetical protein